MYKLLIISYIILLLNCNGTNTRSFIFNYEVSILPTNDKKLAKKGSIFFSIPAAFTHTTGKSHWHALIRTRAIENGCYVFAAAQCGKHKNGRRTFGHSLIVDPWGNIVSEADETIGFISAKIDTKLVKDIRKRLPSTTNYIL